VFEVLISALLQGIIGISGSIIIILICHKKTDT